MAQGDGGRKREEYTGEREKGIAGRLEHGPV